MNSFNTERIFCCSSINLIKNRCFIFLCVSINKCHNPLSLKVLLKYIKRCERAENHLQTISAHNIMCYFHISIIFPAGLDTKKQLQFGLFKTGVRRIIFTEAHFEQDFLNAFSLQKLASSLSFSYNCRQYSGESQCYSIFCLDLAEEIRIRAVVVSDTLVF